MQTAWNILGLFLIICLGILFQFANDSIVDCENEDFITCRMFNARVTQEFLKIYFGCGLIQTIIIYLALDKQFNYWIAIGSISLYIYVVFFFDNVITVSHYGGAVTKIIGFSFIIWFTIVSILRFYYNRLSLQNIRLLILTTLALILMDYKLKSLCKEWDAGIFNGKLEQGPYCQMKFPKYCTLNILEKIMNPSYLLTPNCKNKKENKDLYLQAYKNLSIQDQFAAYPLTNQIRPNQRSSPQQQGGIQETIFLKVKGYESLEQVLQTQAQIILDLQKESYFFNIRQNQELVNKRQNEQIYQPFSQDVLIIFIDAVSKSQFHRLMPNTVAWFQNRHMKQSGASVQYYRFFTVLPWTYPNFVRFYFQAWAQSPRSDLQYIDRLENFPCQKNGNPVKLLNYTLLTDGEQDQVSNYIDFKKYPTECEEKYQEFDDPKLYTIIDASNNQFRRKQANLLVEAKRAGYITGRTGTFCCGWGGDMLVGTDLFLNDDPADHQGMAFACDPYYHDADNPFRIFNGPYSVVNRCAGDKFISQLALEYGQLFFDTYQDASKFFMVEFIQNHEPTSTLVAQLDDLVVHFLNYLDSRGYLDDTLILILSDHGNHMHLSQTFIHLDQYYIEQMNPFLIINTPNSFNQRYPHLFKNIKDNQQQLTNWVNLAFFIRSWIRGDDFESYEHHSKGFLSSEIPPDRSCEDIIGNIGSGANEIHAFANFPYNEVCTCVPQSQN